MNKYIEFSQSIKSSIDHWQHNFNAIREYAPELLETSDRNTVTYISFVNHIADIQNDLNEFNIDRAKKEPNAYQKEIEEAVSKINDKFNQFSKELVSKMPTLLHDFAEILIKKEQESESFASKINEIYLAALADNIPQCDPSSSKLAEKLSSLINSKSFPEKYKESITNIKDSLTTSLYSSMYAQSALAYIKGKIESAQTHAQEIISSQLPTEEIINKLIDELSDDFYIGKFIAFFNALQSEYRAIQQLQVDIKDQLKKLELIYPNCIELKELITKWRLELNELEAITLQDQKLDSLSKLNEQLEKFKEKLERGDYFEQAKKTILNYLPTCEEIIINKLYVHKQNIRQLYFITSYPFSDTIVQLYTKYKSDRDKIQELLKKEKDNYSQYKSLGEILANEKNIFCKSEDIYTTLHELKEYHLIYNILNGTSSQNSIQKINTLCIKEPILKRLVGKLFFMLMAACSDQQQIDYFKNLNQCLKTQGIQPNENTVLFKETLRNRITEIFLEKLYQPKNSLTELYALLRFKKNAGDLLLLEPTEIEWLNKLEKAIDDLESHKRDLDKIKFSYKPNFFLDPSEKKKEAVEVLQKRLEDLQLSTTPEQLEHIFNQWEEDFGSVIDTQRYKLDLIKIFMAIFHRIQTLFSNKPPTTKTRTLVNNIKEQTQVMLEATRAPTPRRIG